MKCFKILLFAVCIHISLATKLKERFSWKEVSYAWTSDQQKTEAITDGRYKSENNLILGLDVWKDKLFITVPRWKSGVASSLNYVNLSSTEQSPSLIPYPSWETNTVFADVSKGPERLGGRADAPSAQVVNGQLHDNASIISTFRIQVDECDRLWVMDCGLADILGEPKLIAKPALVIFDLNTDTLIRRYTFSDSDVVQNSFLANVIVDVPKQQCDNAYAYVPDLGGYGVVVYSFKENKSWRVKHNYFHFDPLEGDFLVGGVNFQWTDGVFGMALGKQTNEGTRDVYFHALASTKEFSVPNYVLQNETRATSPQNYNDFKLVGDRGVNGQSTAEAVHEKTNVLFYTQVNKDSIGCWNINKEFNLDKQGLVDSDGTALVFPNDLKIDRNDNLWILSDRLPVYMYKKLDPEQYNYRILSGPINELILGTPCE
ncbi:protein yellow-like [Contarinia nasturtii]|uniref:protein yellow-like n=1 Tax=Contarinia nasturtii TaxID=265458 RepID=UPI0012D3BB29|nr:protein yellow-like [Contarinia nasturtii]